MKWKPRPPSSVMPWTSKCEKEEKEEEDLDAEVNELKQESEDILDVTARRSPEQENPSSSPPTAAEDNDDHNTTASSVEPQETRQEIWSRRRTVAIYLVTLMFLYADMNLLAPNLSDVGDEFGFDSDERDRRIGGHIAVAFFLVGAPVSFLVGWLADSFKRAPLFAITVVVGEAGCFAVYFTTTFQQLFLCRVFTGVAVGGALPVMYSVLGDIYKAGNRAAIAAVVATGTGVGIALGQGLAGFIGDKDWRLPFLVVSIPSFFCAALVLTLPEPLRGGREAARLEIEAERRRIARQHVASNDDAVEIHSRGDPAPAQESDDEFNLSQIDFWDVPEEISDHAEEEDRIPVESGTQTPPAETALNVVCPEVHNDERAEDMREDYHVNWKTTRQLLGTPSVILVLLQGAPAALPFGMASVYLNDYLSENKGMTTKEATAVLIMFGGGNAIGVILGGFLGHRSYRKDVRRPPVIMGVSVILSAIPMWFLINNVDDKTNKGLVALYAVLTGVLTIIPIPIERAILANVSLPEARGRANSFLGVVDDLGKGLGPVFVSLMIDAWGRRTAFNVSLLGWIIGGIIALFLYFTVRRDEAHVQDLVREYLLERRGRHQEESGATEPAKRLCQ